MMKLRELILYNLTTKNLLLLILLLLIASFPACEDEFYETMQEEGIYFLHKDGTDGVNFNVSDTGQTLVISGVTGEDSDYINIPREPSYTDNTIVTSDSTITDNVTGLMWMKCTYPDTTSDCTGVHNTYTWSQAVTECENWTYAGYDDWYLPASWELFTIVDLSQYPAFNSTFFPDIQHDGKVWENAADVVNGYWASNRTQIFFLYPFFVHFYDGMVNLTDDTKSFYIKCVRKND